MEKAKSANRLYLLILAFYIGASLLIHRFLDTASFPMWLKLTLGEILMLLPAAAYLAVTKTNPRDFIPVRRLQLSTILLLILFAYCMMPLIACVNALSMLIQGGNAVSGMMEQLLFYPLPLSVLFVAVVPALCEEFIFRGLLYHTYRRQRIWPAIFLSAFFFGLMHLNFNQFCYAFVMGIFFALLVEATGSIVAPMIVHFTYNANSTILSWILGRAGYMEAGAAQTELDMMEIIKDSLEASGLSPSDSAAVAGIVLGLVLAAGILLLTAAFFSFLGFLLYRTIARRNGRLSHVQILFSGKERKALDAKRLEHPERLLTWEGWAAAFLGILYIIWFW